MASGHNATISLNVMSTNDTSKPRKTSRDLQAEARREQLLDCAIAVFVEKGPAAGIKDIAAAAGVASGLLYHYFDSKEAILQTILRERNFALPLDAFLREAQGSVPDTLREVALLFHGWMTRIGDFVIVLQLMARKHPQLDQAMRNNVSAQAAALAEYLDARVAAGEVRAHDTTLAARGLLFSIYVGWQAMRLGPEFATGMADLLYQGLRPEPSALPVES